MRASGTEVTGTAYNRDSGVILRAVKAGRASRAALLSTVRVVESDQALQRAAGSVSAVCSSIANCATDRVHWSGRHCSSSAYVASRALSKLPVARMSNTSTVVRSAKCSRVAHNAGHQRVRRRRVATMYVVRSRAGSANTSDRLERYDTSKR